MTILPQLERDLDAAARRLQRDENSTERSLLGRGLAVAPAVVAVLIAAVVAVVALTSLHSAGHANRSRPAARPTVSVARAELLANFSVLQRPQTRDDFDPRLFPVLTALSDALSLLPRRHATYRCDGRRLVSDAPTRPRPIHFPAFLKRQQYPQVDCPLMRLVRIPQWRATALIAPTSFGPTAGPAHRTEDMQLSLDDPRGGITGTDGPSVGPAPLRSILRGAISVFTTVHGGLNHGVILIPDGVAEVTLDQFRPLQPVVGLGIARIDAAFPAYTATAPVNDNLAAFAIPFATVRVPRRRPLPPGSRSGIQLAGINVLARETWRNAADAVILRFRTMLNVIVPFRIWCAPTATQAPQCSSGRTTLAARAVQERRVRARH